MKTILFNIDFHQDDFQRTTSSKRNNNLIKEKPPIFNL